MAAYTTIDNPELYFQVKIYTGNGNDDPGQSITLDGSEDMQPDMVWFKIRSEADYHALYDAVRGATKRIHSDLNSAEGTLSDGLTSFNSDGFTVGDDNGVNKNTATYVAWCWKESADAGFDIIAYTGTGSNMDVSHNLSAVPDFFMIKQRTDDQAWRVYHKNMTTADPYSNRLGLSETTAQTTSALGLDADPTSSVINIGTGTGCTNDSGEDYICYAFAEKQGFSKFGSYTGNGNADGAFVFCGFRPAFIMVKGSNESAQEWAIFDNKRDPINKITQRIQPSSNAAESGGQDIDFLSNGFKLRVNGAFINGSYNYIYMAFAEAPFVNSNGVPCNAR